MKIIIPGGSGQIGAILTRAFIARGDEVVILSRRPQVSAARVTLWNPGDEGTWMREFEGADAVINLAGRSVNCRYTPENRRAIIDSRVQSTQAIARAIAACSSPPPVWLQSSTATIYSHRYDAPNDDIDGVLGGAEPGLADTWKFSLDVARKWEAAAMETVQLPATRIVLMRSAMVMSADSDGVFDVLLRLVRFGLGGRAGNGRQYVSWIHGEDFVRATLWAIAHAELSGPVNFAAPQPLPNAQFMAALRQAWGIGFGLPAAAWMVEIGALAMKTESELILKSRRVVAKRLLDSGFTFEYADWPAAAQALCTEWRAARK